MICFIYFLLSIFFFVDSVHNIWNWDKFGTRVQMQSTKVSISQTHNFLSYRGNNLNGSKFGILRYCLPKFGTSTENLHFMATATTHLYFNYLITQERKKTNNGANFLNGIANTCQKSRKNSLVVNIMHWKILFCVN